MRTRKLLVLLAITALGWLGAVEALDPPHDGSFQSSAAECQSCHRLHGSSGGSLLGGPGPGQDYTSNNDACLTCHDSADSTNHFFSPAWGATLREASPGSHGDQHKWSGSPTGRGARVPQNAAMASYLTPGRTLQCAVCHDAHGAKDEWGSPANQAFAPTSAHASIPFDVEQPPTDPVKNGRMKLIRIDDGGFIPAPAGYAIRIKTAGPGSGTFEISHDYGRSATPTFEFNIPYSVGNTTAQNVGLDDPSVVVRFTVAPEVGDTWVFYVSYPLLRASNVDDAMCLDCHVDRHMGYKCVDGDTTTVDALNANCTPDGIRKFSHPVNEAPNANGLALDRATPLDADGTAGSSTTDGLDGATPVANPSNDLKLVSGRVGCTTCHAPHNADSNSLTVEVR